MSRDLVKSLLFSLGVHAVWMIPWFSGWDGSSVPTADVVRGVSLLSLRLSFSSEWPEGVGEEKALPAASSEPGAWRKSAPAQLRNPAPQYPWRARLRGWEGRVMVQAWVSPSGSAHRVAVGRSSGYGVLDEAAVAAVRRWRFVPAQRNGRAVASRVEVPIVFQIRPESES